MPHTYYQEQQALGSTIGITIISDTRPALIEILFRSLWQEVFLFEKRCSRFIPTSELCQFNDAAGVKQPTSPPFLDVLRAARHMARSTGGLYNPFILPALQRAGYMHSFIPEYAGDTATDYSGRSVTAWENLEIGDSWARIPYGSAIDLGGCGKGYMGDQLAARLNSEHNMTGYWISMGGDVIAAGQQADGQPITIMVSKGGIAGSSVASIVVKPGRTTAVATSTVTKRRGIHNGTSWHHIIDPRTGKPADSEIATATICTTSLLKADVHASNCIILGTHDAEAYAREQRTDGMVLQDKKGEIVTMFGEYVTAVK